MKGKAPKTKVDSIDRLIKKTGIDIQRGSEILQPMEFVSTGSILLNQIIGKPGYPCSLITEIVGHSGGGKSLLCLIAASVATSKGLYVILVDNENNYGTLETREWLETFGINLDFIIRIPPSDAEKSMNATLTMLKELGDKCKLVIVDSASAFVPEKILEKEIGDQTVALSAKLLHSWFDKLRVVNKYAAILVINQHTSKIGMYGNPVTKGGGYAMKYDPHLSIEVKGSPIYGKDADTQGASGMEIDVRITKNKIGPIGRSAKVVINYSFGKFDLLEEIINLAVTSGIIKKSVSYYYIGESAYQGKEKLKEKLLSSSKLLAKIIRRLGYDPSDFGLKG